MKKADKHINLEFEYFFKEWNKFNTINWYKYPSDSSKEWPKIHSSKILLNLEKFGDIKQIWEIGRFAWLYDFVRAWTLSQNDIYLKSALDLIKDFIKKNPIYIGPHWSSEQEVSIRAYALIFFLEATKNCEYLKDEDLLDIHNFLYIHGEYLNKNIHYAEIAIRNNHLIHGAVGLYTISHFFNLHQSSAAWRKKSKKIILDCLNEQWYEDGGYIQPSHIYHRSALHGLLIARKVSYIQNDSIMVKSIDKILDKAFNFLINFISRTDGMLPNWGPNDGSLVFPVTCCDYVDFRPILQTISTLIYKERSFNLIDVNEESIWLYGEDPDKFKIKNYKQKKQISFNEQGLHVMRQNADTYAVFSCGDIKSRYGQQADQLNLDIWKENRNIILDPGSFNYNKDIDIHNWYRGTRSHNTVTINDKDQMLPIRKFKYLKWTKSAFRKIVISNKDYYFGTHNGYVEEDGSWHHSRTFSYINNGWIVIDRVWPDLYAKNEQLIKLNWNIDHRLFSGQNKISNQIKILCSNINYDIDFKLGKKDNPRGWVSRYYNNKESILSANISTLSKNETWFISIIADNVQIKDIYFDVNNFNLFDLTSKDFDIIRKCSENIHF